MELTVVDNPELNRYEARTTAGDVAGFIDYTGAGLQLVLTHTQVDESFAGQGVASKLVRSALQLAKDSGSIVRNECPFIRRFIARHEGQYGWVLQD